MDSMNIYDAISRFSIDTKGFAEGWRFSPDSSIGAFLPEIVLCLTIVAMLVARLFRTGDRIDRWLAGWIGGTGFLIALAGSVIALGLAAPWRHLSSGAPGVADPGSAARMEIFTGLLVYDTFAVYMRGILLLFAVLFLVLTRLTSIPDREDASDIYSLLLGATLGMCLMTSANHLLIVFLAVEMASVPSYALAGLLKGRRASSEAALKYSIFGAAAAGIMLYGISLVAGITNTVHLPSLAAALADLDLPSLIESGQGASRILALTVGGLMLTVGLAFKLSAVPFHFWCPDVFEGASAEIGAFLSVASKAAALALVVRLTLGLGFIPSGGEPFDKPIRPGDRSMAAARSDGASSAGSLFSVSDAPRPHADPPAGSIAERMAAERSAANARLAPVRGFLARLFAFLAIITCTFGNLAAYGQTNIKRLLAYSTIAHAGYMMMAIPAIAALAHESPSGAESAVAGLAIYVLVYLFMNLGAFAVVAFLRNEIRSEQIADYAGLIRRAPMTVICLSIMLFSLVGLPPLAGFIGKFAIFAAVARAYVETSSGYLLVLLVVGSVNTFLSLFYYIRVVKCMTMEPEPDHRAPFRMPVLPGAFVFLLTLPTALLIVGWNGIWEAALRAAAFLVR